MNVVISSEKDMRQQTFLRINGVSPDFSRIAGRSESNESTSGLSKAAPAATSCLQVELIQSDANKTTVYGPDFSDPITGAYHIQGNFPSGDYSLIVEIAMIGSEAPDSKIIDEFRGKITT